MCGPQNLHIKRWLFAKSDHCQGSSSVKHLVMGCWASTTAPLMECEATKPPTQTAIPQGIPGRSCVILRFARGRCVRHGVDQTNRSPLTRPHLSTVDRPTQHVRHERCKCMEGDCVLCWLCTWFVPLLRENTGWRTRDNQPSCKNRSAHPSDFEVLNHNTSAISARLGAILLDSQFQTLAELFMKLLAVVGPLCNFRKHPETPRHDIFFHHAEGPVLLQVLRDAHRGRSSESTISFQTFRGVHSQSALVKVFFDSVDQSKQDRLVSSLMPVPTAETPRISNTFVCASRETCRIRFTSIA